MPHEARWEDDLRDGGEAIAAAGAALEAALDAGECPALFASDCTICMGTLPVLARREPDVRLVWLDAHGDFNTPETTASGFLGGMCLAAACGRWDGGFGAGVDPRRVVLADGRDLDAPEREEMARAGLVCVAPGEVAAAVRGERVFVHLDLDVLDPSEMPFSFPAHGGMSMDALRALLADLARATDVVGLEVTSMAAPSSAGRLAEALAPLVRA
jgi:arginase family enzyme